MGRSVHVLAAMGCDHLGYLRLGKQDCEEMKRPRFRDLGGTIEDRQARMEAFRLFGTLPKCNRGFRQLAQDRIKVREANK